MELIESLFFGDHDKKSGFLDGKKEFFVKAVSVYGSIFMKFSGKKVQFFAISENRVIDNFKKTMKVVLDSVNNWGVLVK